MRKEYSKFPLGVNIFVINNGRLLLGKRKNTYGAGTWGLPGGHLETGETMQVAATRELLEETGLKTNNFEFLNFINESGGNQEHYLQASFIAKNIQGEIILKEPEKCEEWKWFDLDKLPNEILLSHLRQIELFKNNNRFSDF